MNQATIKTRYGLFNTSSYDRLGMLYDYEDGTIQAFGEAAGHLKVEQVIDVGANIGAYGVFLSSLPSVQRIDMFEPSRAAYEEALANANLQEKAEIFHVYPVAASDINGEADFYVVNPLAGNSCLVEKNSGKRTVRVKTATLDSLLAPKKQRLAIKIDVEGHELQVLNGMRNILLENSCLLQVECLNDNLQQAAEKILHVLHFKKLFQLNSDIIFINGNFLSEFDALQGIYFKHLKKELAVLQGLRTEKRNAIAATINLANFTFYKKDPIL